VSCGVDFASVVAFDRHRVGVHEYTHSEGLRLDPPREDGRRCLYREELADVGLELDQAGRWCVPLREADRVRLASLREAA
jgi:hypothetical protein